MLVSVIVPSYNYGSFISETVQSLLSQTYKNWECIIIDDGSTDNTKDVVLDFARQDERIKYIYQNNQGLSAARNTGLSNSQGEFIQFLDADDLIESKKLEIQVEFLNKNKEVDLVYGSVRYFKSDSPSERLYSMSDSDAPWMPEISGSGKSICEKLIEGNIMAVSSPLLRKRMTDLIGSFDLQLGMFADWDYWIRCAVAGMNFQFLSNNETLALVRIHPISMTQNIGKYYFEKKRVRQKISKYPLGKEILELNRFLQGVEGSYNGIGEFRNGKKLNGLMSIIKSGAISKRGLWHVVKGIIEQKIYQQIKRVK